MYAMVNKAVEELGAAPHGLECGPAPADDPNMLSPRTGSLES